VAHQDFFIDPKAENFRKRLGLYEEVAEVILNSIKSDARGKTNVRSDLNCRMAAGFYRKDSDIRTKKLNDFAMRPKGACVPVCPVSVGKRVQRLRKNKGWTQTDMAVSLDMNRGHISDIERGKREVGIITLQVIARGLETTMANLLRGL